MNLTDYQKDIIKKIESGLVYSYDSYIEKDAYFEKKDSIDNVKLYIVENKDIVEKKVREFFSLWHILEKSNLIRNVSINKPITEIIYMDNGKKNSLNPHLKEGEGYYHKKIIPLNYLEDFIKNNYLTYEEKIHKIERKHTRLGLRIALITSILSISLSICFSFRPIDLSDQTISKIINNKKIQEKKTIYIHKQINKNKRKERGNER